MSWLLREGDVLAAIETRRPGWPAAFDGVVVLRGPVVVHTLTAAVSLDLAWCSPERSVEGPDQLVVRRIGCLGPRRVAFPLVAPRPLIVAGGGAFERWRLKVGDRLEIREV